MSVIFLLIPLSILFAVAFLFAFIWSVRSGQYEDTTTPSMRVLLDERTTLQSGQDSASESSVQRRAAEDAEGRKDCGGKAQLPSNLLATSPLRASLRSLRLCVNRAFARFHRTASDNSPNSKLK